MVCSRRDEMKGMSERKSEAEAACAAAVKERKWKAAAEAAEKAADCAEILAGRTSGAVAAAYAKEVESWRALAKKLEGKKETRGGSAAGAGSSGKRAEAEDAPDAGAFSLLQHKSGL